MNDLKIRKPRNRTAREGAPAISRLLRKVRTEAQLTQADAARQIGVALPTLSRIENGDLRISARNLEKILNFFDLTLSAKLIDEPSTGSKANDLPDW